MDGHFGPTIYDRVTLPRTCSYSQPECYSGLVWFRGLTPQQQPGSYQGGEMMMKSVFWWRKPEHPEETTDLRQVTDETFHTYGLCPVRGLNSGRSGVKQSELRRNESGAVAHSVWGDI